MSKTYFYAMRNVSKGFGATRALDKVDFEIDQGEIVGLVGDNAAGKSTLMKNLSGAFIADGGGIYVDNKRVHITNPVDPTIIDELTRKFTDFRRA